MWKVAFPEICAHGISSWPKDGIRSGYTGTCEVHVPEVTRRAIRPSVIKMNEASYKTQCGRRA